MMCYSKPELSRFDAQMREERRKAPEGWLARLRLSFCLRSFCSRAALGGDGADGELLLVGGGPMT